MKDVDRRRDIDDDRENGTDGEDRKGSFSSFQKMGGLLTSNVLQ